MVLASAPRLGPGVGPASQRRARLHNDVALCQCYRQDLGSLPGVVEDGELPAVDVLDSSVVASQSAKVLSLPASSCTRVDRPAIRHTTTSISRRLLGSHAVQRRAVGRDYSALHPCLVALSASHYRAG